MLVRREPPNVNEFIEISLQKKTSEQKKRCTKLAKLKKPILRSPKKQTNQKANFAKCRITLLTILITKYIKNKNKVQLLYVQLLYVQVHLNKK